MLHRRSWSQHRVELLISIICLFIGVIRVAFDPNQQGWHDKMTSTYVIRT